MPLVFRARSVVTTASGTFGHLRIFTFQRARPGRLRRRVHPAGRAAAGRRTDPRRPRQRRRPHLRQRVHPADADAAPDRPEPVQFSCTALNLADLPAAQGQPRPARSTSARGSRRWTRRSRPVRPSRGVPDQPGGRGQRDRPALPRAGRARHRCPLLLRDRHLRRRVSRTTDRPGPGRRRRTPAPAARTCGPTPCSSSAARSRRRPRVAVQGRCRGGANMRVAIRRTLRVGGLAGTPVEDLGVRARRPAPDDQDDVLGGNKDLLDTPGPCWPRCRCGGWTSPRHRSPVAR